MQKYPILLTLLMVVTLVACGGERDLRDYYFPVRPLTDGLVYEYTNLGNMSSYPYEYWYFLGVEQEDNLYLSATRYADGLTPDQVARERVTNEGIVLDQLTVFPTSNDTARATVNTTIIYDKIFPFYPERGAAAGYRIRYSDPRAEAGNTTYVTLDRRLRGDTVINVLGADRAAVVFDLAIEVSLREPTAGDISPTISGYEIYAKDIGLVEYRRNLGAGGTLGGKLNARVPMEEYAARFAENKE